MNLAKDKKVQISNPVQALMKLLSRLDAVEERLVKGIFTEKDQILAQLARDAEAMREAFRHDCRDLLDQQHARDFAEVDAGMVRQLHKHHDKWQAVFMELRSAAADSHSEIKAKIDLHTQVYGEVLQRVVGTEYRKTSDLQDLEVACKILQSREK